MPITYKDLRLSPMQQAVVNTCRTITRDHGDKCKLHAGDQSTDYRIVARQMISTGQMILAELDAAKVPAREQVSARPR